MLIPKHCCSKAGLQHGAVFIFFMNNSFINTIKVIKFVNILFLNDYIHKSPFFFKKEILKLFKSLTFLSFHSHHYTVFSCLRICSLKMNGVSSGLAQHQPNITWIPCSLPGTLLSCLALSISPSVSCPHSRAHAWDLQPQFFSLFYSGKRGSSYRKQHMPSVSALVHGVYHDTVSESTQASRDRQLTN